MKLLLKVKNGTPPQRKSALRQLTDKARDLGAGPLFNQILPLLMSPTLEDQERHLLVKVCTPICPWSVGCLLTGHVCPSTVFTQIIDQHVCVSLHLLANLL